MTDPGSNQAIIKKVFDELKNKDIRRVEIKLLGQTGWIRKKLAKWFPKYFKIIQTPAEYRITLSELTDKAEIAPNGLICPVIKRVVIGILDKESAKELYALLQKEKLIVTGKVK